MMESDFCLSNKIDCFGELKEYENIISVNDIKKFIKLLKEEINSKEVWRVINGKLSQEVKDAFREGEEIGLKNKRKQDLEIINKLAGDKLI